LTQALTSWVFDESKLSEEEAATIPVTLCTAADALYNKMEPVLPLPGGGGGCGWPIVIWGGSSQVGVQAIQLAKQSGCTPIITTSSPKVFSHLRVFLLMIAF
jgi:NADPH:quinone reductase-like Zn-dependent oxidoreductase